ncbi:MAG TPA: tRNA preQ1(34) S-adenosylmethionine ribosyltransferase-isomerase QueA [Gemmatimonadales bacterium]|nr:tRNA preQ1(34) S-adenosylmethionine ribosyltransferase-isomerase QueA [Gemmatimonadales bacterium]
MTRPLHTGDFDFDLPPDRIAQIPLADRSASRLLVLDRARGSIAHRHFRDLPELIGPADVVVLNASRVIPARLHGKRDSGGDAEILLVKDLGDDTWEAMGHPGGKLKPGRRVTFGDDAAVEILEVLGGGLRRVKFVGTLDASGTLAKYGEIPLPPYITRAPDAADRERYQTVYAAHDGSVAAPTAGLHFTPEVLIAIRDRGASIVTLDLHVGPGTFRPVDVDDPAAHVMHPETYAVSQETAEEINDRRAGGGRIWAVGTTVVRTLETVAEDSGRVRAGAGETRAFITPPYRFKAVDRMVTNFHLPRSTLLMLVCAFGGMEQVLDAYRTAVDEGYRFYSYGDAMVIV